MIVEKSPEHREGAKTCPKITLRYFGSCLLRFCPTGKKKTASLRDEYAVSVSLRYAELVPHAVSTNSQNQNPTNTL